MFGGQLQSTSRRKIKKIRGSLAHKNKKETKNKTYLRTKLSKDHKGHSNIYISLEAPVGETTNYAMSNVCGAY